MNTTTAVSGIWYEVAISATKDEFPDCFDDDQLIEERVMIELARPVYQTVAGTVPGTIGRLMQDLSYDEYEDEDLAFIREHMTLTEFRNEPDEPLMYFYFEVRFTVSELITAIEGE